jgi:gluconolactonase
MTEPGLTIATPGGESSGPTYEILDSSFGACIDPVAWLERLYTGARWTEGPVYLADLQCLLFSDIPNQRTLLFNERTDQVSLLRAETGHANGNTRDHQGRLVTCEQGARRVARTEPDGSVTVLADRYQGRRLNSPNDVVVRSDGTIWFTDPTYGILSDYVGNKAEQEIATNNVYRLDPRDGSLTVVADDFSMPNGLAFSPDESTLYVADSGFLTDAAAPRHIRRFAVREDGTLAGGEVLAEIAPGIPDGFRVDTDGRIWTSAADGVHCLTPSGETIGKILVPEVTANLTFGGPKRNRLYITATTSLYAVYTNVTGAQRP